MCTNGYRSGYLDKFTTDGCGYQADHGLRKRDSEEVEKGEPMTGVASKASQEPFGDESHSEIKYRTMHWWEAGMTMIAETISLGILSLPSVLAAVGLVP